MGIGEHIKEERIRKGMSQSALAKKMDVSPTVIGHWERGRRVPKMETVSRIAAALGVEEYVLDPSLVSPKAFDTPEDFMQAWIKGGDGAEKDTTDNPAASVARVRVSLDKLNNEGKAKAAEMVELIAKIPEYSSETPMGKDSTQKHICL